MPGKVVGEFYGDNFTHKYILRLKDVSAKLKGASGENKKIILNGLYYCNRI